MKRLNTIKYIAETSIEDIVKKVDAEKLDVFHVIQASKEARKEFGLKVEALLIELSKRQEKYITGTILEAKEDCFNNFRKGQRVTVTKAEDENHDVLVDDLAMLDAYEVRKYFNIVGFDGLR